MNAALQALLPPGVSCAADFIEHLDEPLHREEKPGTERMVSVRLREFVAGRTVARRALRQLAGCDAPIPRNADRSPRWPEGFCGSISHSRRYAIAVVARRSSCDSLGVDIEDDSRVEQNLWGVVMSPRELVFLKSLPEPQALGSAALLFSAKEAYYKCLPRHFHEESQLPEPGSIEVSIGAGDSTLHCSVSLGGGYPSLQGKCLHFDGHWITLFSIP